VLATSAIWNPLSVELTIDSWVEGCHNVCSCAFVECLYIKLPAILTLCIPKFLV
jgi:hypothetical protein